MSTDYQGELTVISNDPSAEDGASILPLNATLLDAPFVPPTPPEGKTEFYLWHYYGYHDSVAPGQNPTFRGNVTYSTEGTARFVGVVKTTATAGTPVPYEVWVGSSPTVGAFHEIGTGLADGSEVAVDTTIPVADDENIYILSGQRNQVEAGLLQKILAFDRNYTLTVPVSLTFAEDRNNPTIPRFLDVTYNILFGNEMNLSGEGQNGGNSTVYELYSELRKSDDSERWFQARLITNPIANPGVFSASRLLPPQPNWGLFVNAQMNVFGSNLPYGRFAMFLENEGTRSLGPVNSNYVQYRQWLRYYYRDGPNGFPVEFRGDILVYESGTVRFTGEVRSSRTVDTDYEVLITDGTNPTSYVTIGTSSNNVWEAVDVVIRPNDGEHVEILFGGVNRVLTGYDIFPYGGMVTPSVPFIIEEVASSTPNLTYTAFGKNGANFDIVGQYNDSGSVGVGFTNVINKTTWATSGGSIYLNQVGGTPFNGTRAFPALPDGLLFDGYIATSGSNQLLVGARFILDDDELNPTVQNGVDPRREPGVEYLI